MVPFAKTGGLGDVIGALPHALARQGHDVRAFIPHYGFLDTADYHLEPLGWTLRLPVGDKEVLILVDDVETLGPYRRIVLSFH